MNATVAVREAEFESTTLSVEDDLSKLEEIALGDVDVVRDQIIETLKRDHVALVRGATQEQADDILLRVTEFFGLSEALEIQAGFASVKGHRENLGKYFMSVNKRTDYQFIPPHSEGTRFTNMHIASLYCYENTTDGGENILMNVNSESDIWESMSEISLKVDIGDKKLTPTEVSAAKMMFQITLPDDLISATDKVVKSKPSHVPGIKMFDVLTPSKPTHSVILDKDVNVYWDNMASTDYDSAKEYYAMLTTSGLLREPEKKRRLQQYDNAAGRRVWSSGAQYSDLFTSKLTLKLQPGDLIIQNNLTWVHSTCNWTPASGNRKVAAAFA